MAKKKSDKPPTAVTDTEEKATDLLRTAKRT
jgi:hypothetical protein